MKKAVGSTLVAAQLMVFWFAVAQTKTSSPAPTDLRTGSDQPGPVIAVSPDVLDFGLVGVKRTKTLVLTVRNVGGGTLKGKATVADPFSFVDGKAYSLRSGQSQQLIVQYRPTAEGTNRESVVFSGGSTATVLVTGSARIPPRPPEHVRTVLPSEVEAADFIAKYYTDQTSYVLKPVMMEGSFLTICDRPRLLKLAGARPRRELAFIMLIHYPSSEEEEPLKLAWANDLKSLGYQHVVFLRSLSRTNVSGLSILPDPQAPAMSAGK
jgi:hypothetical protein